MINFDSITASFARAICQAAAQVNLAVRQEDVQRTLSVVNHARGVVTLCYRLRVSSKAALRAGARLSGRRHTYRATFPGMGGPVRVQCVLAGAVLGGGRVDWTGQPVQALG